MAQDANRSALRLPPFRDAFGGQGPAFGSHPQPQPQPAAFSSARLRPEPSGTHQRFSAAGPAGAHPQPQPGGTSSVAGFASTHQHAQPGPSRPPAGRGGVPAVGGGAPPAPPAPSTRPSHQQSGVGLGRGGGGARHGSLQPSAAQPGTAVDPARAALDASLVAACTSAIYDYRHQRTDKQTAVSRLYGAVVAAQYDPATHLGPYLAQLDQHDSARAAAAAAAAATAASNPQQADGGPPGGDSMENAQSRARKHGRATRGNGDGDDDDSGSSSSSSDDDGDRPRKRSSFDPKRAGFKDAVCARTKSPHVRRTLDVRDNYLCDLKAAKRHLMRGGNYPPFPDALWESVLADRFVDFDKILSVRFRASAAGTDHPVGADGAYLHVPDTRASKNVTTRSQWQECFLKWSKAVVFAYPHRNQELLAYQDFIQRQFDTIHEDFHERVIKADAAIRDEVSVDPTLSFFDKDELRDIGFRHISSLGSEVHSRTTAPHAPPPAKAKSSKRTREVCQRYNLGRCYTVNCKYQHVCSRPGCGARHSEQEHGESEKTQKPSASGNDRSKPGDRATK